MSSNDPLSSPHRIPQYDSDSGELEPLPISQTYLSQCATPLLPTGINATTPSSATTQDQRLESLGEIFRVGECLYGTTMEGALSILDAAATFITRVVSAPSQRTAYMVTASSGMQSTKYLCLLPPPTTTTANSSQPFPTCCRPNDDSVYYCTCRSFLEKNNRSQHLQLCKHLLALVLLPHVSVKCNTVETLTDEEFGRLLVRSTSSSMTT